MASQAVRTLRPLRRRAAITRRPFLVNIRLRNPCVFFRLRLFGWYVGFTTSTSSLGKDYPSL